MQSIVKKGGLDPSKGKAWIQVLIVDASLRSLDGSLQPLQSYGTQEAKLTYESRQVAS